MNQGLVYEFDQVNVLVDQVGTLVSTVTIQQRANAVSAYGQPDLSDWASITGLVGLSGMLSVPTVFRPDQTATIRKDDQFEVLGLRHLYLNDYFGPGGTNPQILQQHSALIDGARYEIMAVEFDSQKQTTRLAVRYWTQ